MKRRIKGSKDPTAKYYQRNKDVVMMMDVLMEKHCCIKPTICIQHVIVPAKLC